MKRMNFPGRKEARKKQVEQMAEVRANRSNAEQIRLLDQRLGKGKGAKKERARLSEKKA